MVVTVSFFSVTCSCSVYDMCVCRFTDTCTKTLRNHYSLYAFFKLVAYIYYLLIALPPGCACTPRTCHHTQSASHPRPANQHRTQGLPISISYPPASIHKRVPKLSTSDIKYSNCICDLKGDSDAKLRRQASCRRPEPR